MTIRRRLIVGFTLLSVLFLSLVLLQLVVADRLQAANAREAAAVEQTIDENHLVLQYMTDAETAVRGFQLTGESGYLGPYDEGRKGAFLALNELADSPMDSALRALVSAQRQAAAHWLYAYGIPIVNAGRADADVVRAARGKEMFDQIRAANAAVDDALHAEKVATVAAARRAVRVVELLFGSLAVLVLLTAVGIALLHQRQLFQPLEHIRLTLRRLAAGDLSARAEAIGPGEMRAVIGSLNDLASEVQRLITAEQTRAAVGELRQQVAAELRAERDPKVTGRRIAALIGAALGADAVCGRVVVGPGAGLVISWPDAAATLDPELVRAVRAGEEGMVRVVAGGLAMALSGDAECPPGLIHATRTSRPDWTDAERRLLAGLGREIDHGVRQMRLRQRQERLITELRTLDAQKDVFVSTVTHELRTPLTSILGYTEMLTEGEVGDLSPIQERSLTAIQRNAHRLEATVSDLLLLDRANDRVSGETGPVDLAAVLTALHDELATTARAKDLRSVVSTEPAWVQGDGVQLERALRKLVENAIKFTPSGGHFELRLATDGPQAVLTVADTGMGIPADDLPGLFTPFHRAANAMEQAVQGPGLGLAIVRNIVTEHGGTVTAHSELGNGSTFTVTLPAIPAVQPAHS